MLFYCIILCERLKWVENRLADEIVWLDIVSVWQSGHLIAIWLLAPILYNDRHPEEYIV